MYEFFFCVNIEEDNDAVFERIEGVKRDYYDFFFFEFLSLIWKRDRIFRFLSIN